MKSSSIDYARLRVRKTCLVAASLALSSLIATSAQAYNPPQLVANALASATGGCNGCGHFQDQTVYATVSPPITSSAADALASGSYAHAYVTTDFGTLHAYADAFLAAGDPSPDAQARADSQYVDYFAAGSFPSIATLTFVITGSHTPSADLIGPGADAELSWDFVDVTTNEGLAFGNWSSTDAPPVPVVASVAVPLNHATALRVIFSASAYASPRQNPFQIFADYSNTVHTYIDAGAGMPDVIGTSGHDYALPVSAAVPEPASWALLIVGFGLVGTAMRRGLPAIA